MKAYEAKEIFLDLASSFFKEYSVIFSNQSRIAKPKIPLVVLTPGNISRPQAANERSDDGDIIGYYLSRMPIIIDLFTNGKAVKNDNDEIVAFSNTAVDEMLAFADYLNGPKGVAWCDKHDVSILIESEVQDLSGIINETNYEYRSRLEVLFFFTQETDRETGRMGYFTSVALDNII